MTGPDKQPRHRSHIFLLEEGSVTPLAQAVYVRLAQGQETLPQLAGRCIRLADWYVEVLEGQQVRRVSEWYGWVNFDESVRLDPTPGTPAASRTGNVDPTALPTLAEIEWMHCCVSDAQGEQEGST